MYLSIVMCGNNAGYGGNFLERMQNCVNSIFAVPFDGEFVFVEFGPPENRPGMAEAINWSKSKIPIRIIQVPKSVTDGIPNPNKIPFFEPWAKSVGVRRAAGEFILTTNADSVYPVALMEFLSSKQLDNKCFYRVNRHDVNSNGEVYLIQRANGAFKPGEPYENVSQSDVPYSPDMPHYNASGEFILMSKEKYHEIHGWPELTYWGSVDGMVCWLAKQAGLKQVVLPYPIYHADHSRNPRYGEPPWTDGTIRAEKNGDNWGFNNLTFNEVHL